MKEPKRNEIIWVPARELKVHPTAQRDGVVRAKVRKFEKEMDLDALGTFHAVRRGASLVLWVIDGQHRLLALMNLGLGDWVVAVELHVAVDSDARASDLFLKLNDRSLPKPYETFRNAVQARRSAESEIETIASVSGFRVAGFCADWTLACVQALREVHGMSPNTLQRTLDIIANAWGGEAASLEGAVVKGIGIVCNQFPGLDHDALAKKLAKYPGGASALMGRARGLRDLKRGTALPRCVAEVVVDLYDYGRRTGRLQAEP